METKTVLTKEGMEHILILLTAKKYIFYLVFALLDLISAISLMIVGKSAFLFPGLFLILLGIVIAFLPFLNIIFIKQSINHDKDLKDTIIYTYEFLEDSVIIKIDDVAIKKKYSDFKKVKVIPSYLVLMESKDKLYFMDRKNLNNEELKNIIERF